MESRQITLCLGSVFLSETSGSEYVDICSPRSLHEQRLVKPQLERLRCMWHGIGSV